MLLNVLVNWRITVWGLALVLLTVGSFLPQGGLLLAGWWVGQEAPSPVCWRVTCQTAGCPRRWLRVRRLYCWGSAALWVGLTLWLLGWLLIQPAPPRWVWLCLAVLIVDGVNVKVLCPSGTYRVNQRGQRREVKRCESRVILAALGVWANTWATTWPTMA